MLALSEFFLGNSLLADVNALMASANNSQNLNSAVPFKPYTDINLKIGIMGTQVGITVSNAATGNVAFPCTVGCDYSIFCPQLNAFVKPEDTNIKVILGE